MPTVALCNLGCSKNVVDGERILHHFKECGYTVADAPAAADVIVVNTCSFIREATQEAIDSVLEMAGYKRDGRCRTLVVSGCFSQRHREQAAREFPEVDVWTGVDTWEEDLRPLLGRGTGSGFRRHLTQAYGGEYLKIAEGCSHGCTFCVIPSIRGPYKSRGIPEILEEARWLRDQGVRECILVSQDTSFYGRDADGSIVGLLERLLAKVDFDWIRLMYLNPRWVDETLIKLIASEPRLCSYYDIPLQHISDTILAGMRRQPRSRELRRLVESIRTLDPRAAIRTSFIVGFPGETKSEFQDLVKFVEEARFDKLGVFPFSPEEGTPAALLRPRPRSATVTSRCEELMSVQRDVSRELLAAKKGARLKVMVDGPSEHEGYGWEGRTEFDAPEVDGQVYIKSAGALKPGDFAEVRVVETGDYDLYGEA